jgi:hypothetical protein
MVAGGVNRYAMSHYLYTGIPNIKVLPYYGQILKHSILSMRSYHYFVFWPQLKSLIAYIQKVCFLAKGRFQISLGRFGNISRSNSNSQMKK